MITSGRGARYRHQLILLAAFLVGVKLGPIDHTMIVAVCSELAVAEFSLPRDSRSSREMFEVPLQKDFHCH